MVEENNKKEAMFHTWT